MHSSKMRTVRSSSHVYPSMYWVGRGVYPSMHWAGGVSQHALGEGCVSQHALGGGMCVSLHSLGRGVYPSIYWAGGVSAQVGGCLSTGVCIPACTEADTPTCEQNDRQTGVKTLPFRNFVCGRQLLGTNSRTTRGSRIESDRRYTTLETV